MKMLKLIMVVFCFSAFLSIANAQTGCGLINAGWVYNVKIKQIAPIINYQQTKLIAFKLVGCNDWWAIDISTENIYTKNITALLQSSFVNGNTISFTADVATSVPIYGATVGHTVGLVGANNDGNYTH